MYSARKKVFWFAILSRISIFILQIIFNTLCPDHDADAFKAPADPTEKYSYLDNIANFLFGGLTKWDAQYYVHIAKYGYTYENSLAFYPLFPLLIRYVTTVFQIEPPILNYSNTIVISGFVINFVCFVKAALILYDLSERVFKDIRVAYRTAIFFCINPASIFFTAIYTESLFAYLTFYVMLESASPCVFIPLSLSSLVRSNGLVNLGFPIYVWLRNLYLVNIPSFISEIRQYHSNKRSLFFDFRHIFISVSQIIFLVILSLLPFSFLQVYNYSKFCKVEFNVTALPYHVQQYARDNNLLMPGNSELDWCHAMIPMSYSYVQNKYWNVGFLKYYQLKQIPNFVLALPILYITLRCIIEYFNEHKSKICKLEFFTEEGKTEKHKYPLEMFVFVVHGLFLMLLCVFYVHIQVSTRLLCSASPLVYWYCALVTLQEDKKSKETKQLEYESPVNLFSKWKVFFLSQKKFSSKEKFIYGYFLGYFIVGCFMYPNFLPWT